MGKVWLVGAGPGAPDLLTVRAARMLETADIVFHDALVHPDTLALARCKRVNVGKRFGRASTDQRFIERALVEAARTHEIVVRLKGGDPMLFGRAQEEIDALAAEGIEVEVVPGVTAALAASASTQLSLTRRGIARHVAFVTPRTGAGQSPGDWLAVARAADSVAFYMASSQAREVATALIESGRPASTPALFVENASLASERRVHATLQDLRTGPSPSFEGPALLLVGEAFQESSPQAADGAQARHDSAERCRLRTA